MQGGSVMLNDFGGKQKKTGLGSSALAAVSERSLCSAEDTHAVPYSITPAVERLLQVAVSYSNVAVRALLVAAAVLSCAVPCCAALCRAVPCSAVLCCIVLYWHCCAVLCFAVLCCAVPALLCCIVPQLLCCAVQGCAGDAKECDACSASPAPLSFFFAFLLCLNSSFALFTLELSHFGRVQAIVGGKTDILLAEHIMFSHCQK